MPNRFVPYEEGMKTGLGYDRLSGSVSPTAAVEWSGVSGPMGSGQQVTADCVVIQDVEELHTALGISVDAAGSYMGFSGNAKTEYAKSCDFSSFATYAMVRVSVQNSFQSVDGPRFNADGTELIVNNHPQRFRERFGDAFIAGARTGGEYFAIYQFTGTDRSERESLAIQVHAAFNGLIASAELNASIRNSVSSSRSHLELHVHVFRQGTINEVDFALADIIATAKRFPVDVSAANSFPYSVLLQDYSGLHSPNDSFNYLDIQNRQDVLADLAKKRFQFLALRDDLSYALQHLEDFQNPDGSAIDRTVLDAERIQVVNAINAMQRAAAECARDATKCEFPPFDVGTYPRPVPKPSAASAPTTPAVPGLLGFTPLTPDGTFPAGAHVPAHGGTLDKYVGILSDVQGRPTVVDTLGTVSRIGGATLPAGGEVSVLSQGAVGTTYLTLALAVDTAGRMTVFWVDPAASPPVWQAARLGSQTFPPGAQVSSFGGVFVAVDTGGALVAFTVADVVPSSGRVTPLGSTPFAPGAAVGPATIDTGGRLCTVTIDGGFSPSGLRITSVASGFTPGGVVRGTTDEVVTIDAQGRVAAVWRETSPAPGPWQLTPLSAAGFVAGSAVTGFWGTKPLQHSPYPLDYHFRAATAFVVDRQGRLCTVEYASGQKVRDAQVAAISDAGLFPAGAPVTVLNGGSVKTLAAAAIDNWGRVNVAAYHDSSGRWDVTAVAGATVFPPGGRIAAGVRTGSAIDVHGSLALISPDWSSV